MLQPRKRLPPRRRIMYANNRTVWLLLPLLLLITGSLPQPAVAQGEYGASSTILLSLSLSFFRSLSLPFTVDTQIRMCVCCRCCPVANQHSGPIAGVRDRDNQPNHPPGEPMDGWRRHTCPPVCPGSVGQSCVFVCCGLFWCVCLVSSCRELPFRGNSD